MPTLLLSRLIQNCKTDCLILVIIAILIVRPFLDTLKNIQKEGSKLSRKLQLISTDTWDISDELTDYTEIADQLIVSSLSTALC